MLRRSRYVLVIPLQNREFLFVNTFTGAILFGPEEILRILNGVNPEQETSEEVSALVSQGFLTELSPKEETEKAFKSLESIQSLHRDHTLFALIPTYDCNMRCDYCYVSSVFTRDEPWLQRKMTHSQVDAAFKAMETLNPHTRAPIHLLGGEPLISSNYELIEYILTRGTRCDKSFIIVTNGLESSLFLPLLLESKITSLQITVDGIEEIHNRRKKRADGTGSFCQIVESIDQLAEAGFTVYVRVNIDHSTVRTLPSFMEFAHEKGWDQRDNMIYLSPVRHHTPGGCYNFMHNLKKEDLQFLLGDEVLRDVFLRGLGPIAQKLGFVDKWLPQMSYCRSYLSQTWFDPFGDIYLCTDTLGNKEEAVGTYYPEVTFNERFNQWKERTIFNMKSCRHCRYAMICGGGCGNYAAQTKGDLLKPDCEFSNQAVDVYYPLFGKMIQGERKRTQENIPGE
ncbi:MAG: radical SAM protein [Theionarchaea archaeon]|nr:radical SAM protein [Theionarchaea archaeon]MBU7000425.1 radical SAM protein [Theionarchaea archaeon]MBU7021267.1 radical SAM protein [Theionarchaea archaeon]MBU7035290.1 radical SAM protein [Theionarchaea archaeon]MBU7039759.1 radical SAM protein [Theionarchaea archaeon]